MNYCLVKTNNDINAPSMVTPSPTLSYYIMVSHNKTLAKEECLMGYGGTGGGTYFDGSFILFLVLILLVFGMGFGGIGGKC